MVFADLDKDGIHIPLIALPTLTINKYLALAPDFLVQVLKQLMLSPVIGEKKLTGSVHQSTLLPECYDMLEKPRPIRQTLIVPCWHSAPLWLVLFSDSNEAADFVQKVLELPKREGLFIQRRSGAVLFKEVPNTKVLAMHISLVPV